MRQLSTLLLALSALLVVSVPQSVAAGKSDPVQGKPQICPKARSGWDAQRLVGKRMVKAKRIAASHGCTIRVTRRNGEDLASTDDYRPNRINVAVRGEQRRIVRVFGFN